MTRKQIQLSTSLYLTKAKEIISNNFPNDNVVVQISQSTNLEQYVFYGAEEIFNVVQNYLTKSRKRIKLWIVKNKKIINGCEPVVEISGKYQDIIELEGILNGIIARGSSIATNSWLICNATTRKIIFMGDRQDHFVNHAFDGSAAAAGGINIFTTKQHVINLPREDVKIVGTIPHSILAYCHGDVIKAGQIYLRSFENSKLILLVDYQNNVIKDSLKAISFFQRRLFAVRVDTPSHLLDKSLKNYNEKVCADDYGGSAKLIKKLRHTLDENNGKHVKIILTSSVDYDKIVSFERMNVPVDYYGVGKAILNISLNFSANITRVNNEYEAKVGKKYMKNKELIRVL